MVTGTISVDHSVGVLPFTVQFTLVITSGTPVSYLWDFGDGSSSTVKNPSHIYTSIGNSRVYLSILDTIGDTTVLPVSPLVISVGKIAFEASAVEGASPLAVNFTNYCVAPAGLGFSGWTWNFGDDTTLLGVTGPSHVYTQDGQYNVTLSSSLG